jgi:hypothetical protein
MGTSTNQPSPDTPSWRLARAVLGRKVTPLERQSQEIWQAALADRGGLLSSELGNPLLAEACRLAEARLAPSDAINAFHQRQTETYATSLILEIGKRALVRACAAESGGLGFASELFSETVAYYVARDLPSVVGARELTATTTEAIRLKDEIKAIARNAASTTKLITTDPEGWQSYVSSVVAGLRRGSSQ